jgi:hypothetical protein
MERHISLHHPGLSVDELHLISSEPDDLMNDRNTRRRKSSGLSKGANPTAGSNEIRESKHRKLKKSGVSLKPVEIHSSLNITDESGRLIGYKFWIENQQLGDSHGHAAQNTDIRSSTPSYLQIVSVPNTYQKFPVLILRKPNASKTPRDQQKTQERIEKLAAPCLWCNEQVTVKQWDEHVKNTHPEKYSTRARLAFQKQKIRCGVCNAIISFKDIKLHYYKNHSALEVVEIRI